METPAPKYKYSTDYPFYNAGRWRSVSTRYRALHPLCEVSQAEGLTVAAEVTDHIVPISKGGSKYDPDNHMALSHFHHNKKRGFEATGYHVATAEGQGGLVPADRMEIIEKLIRRDHLTENWI